MGILKRNLNRPLALLAVSIPAPAWVPSLTPGLFADGGTSTTRRLADDLLV